MHKKSILICLALIGCLFLFSCATLFKGITEPAVDLVILAPIVTAYHRANQQWPKNKEELEEFAKKNRMDFDWSKYCDITVTPEDEDCLLIEAELAPPRSGSWSMMMTVREGDDKPTSNQTSK